MLGRKSHSFRDNMKKNIQYVLLTTAICFTCPGVKVSAQSDEKQLPENMHLFFDYLEDSIPGYATKNKDWRDLDAFYKSSLFSF